MNMTKITANLPFFVAFLLFFVLFSCAKKPEVYTPKPKGYYRITLPEHAFQPIDTTLPFACAFSAFATDSVAQQEHGNIWVYLHYPQFNADLNLSYAPLRGDLRERVLEEEHRVEFHYKVADDVEYSVVNDAESRLFGQIYDVKGSNVACPLSFWLTDSTRHFVRASLYFNHAPNNDSLQPVINFIREDVMEMVNSFQWKQ